MKQTMSVLVAVVVSFAIAVPGWASPPERSDLSFSLQGADCGDGLTYDIDLVGTEIVRDQGDKVWIKQNWDGQAVASDGTVIRVHHSFSLALDFADGTGTFTGLGYGTWVDGGTAKKLDAGVLVFDLTTGEVLFSAGQVTENFDPHVLTCELIRAA